MDTPRRILRTLDLALRIGETLLANGAGTADVQATMSAICHHLGLRGTYVDVTYVMLTIIHQEDLDDVPLALRRNVRQRETDFEDLTDVDLVVSRLLADEIDLDEARRQVAAISTRGHRRPRWSVIASGGLVGAGIALLIGGDWIVALIAAVAAWLIELVRYRMARRRLPEFYIQIAGGLCASLLAVGAAALHVPASPSLVISANIVVLLAGLGFIGAIQDALTGYYLTATARVFEVLLSTSGIIVGVSTGLMVGGVLGVDVANQTSLPALSQLPAVVGGAAIAAMAFAHSSYAPWRIIVPVGAIAGPAAGLIAVIGNTGLDRAFATAVGAILIGVVSYPVSRWGRVPTLVVVVSTIVPMLPGLTIYRSLSQLAEQNLSGIFQGITAAGIAVALAAGVIFGEYVAQPLAHETRRLERRLAGPRLVGPFRAKSWRRERKRRP
ncbi:threonine/serine exporter ThrE family protein [uncultured Aeromicrobium sp.]|uniref:threonine/serine ThrE exporter family protein n=1 Tax=uncultured Aeromicrobium sp. TaxID=337820 RepID=UPI0025D40297|nr:threonine/serine exporter family protein [uncultured Aeromicrobium sp.]